MISKNVRMAAYQAEIAKLEKKLASVAHKIEKASSWGSDLMRAYNSFAMKFNQSSCGKEKLDLIEKYKKEEKTIHRYSKYSICDLIDQQVKIEGDIRELRNEVALEKWRARDNTNRGAG